MNHFSFISYTCIHMGYINAEPKVHLLKILVDVGARFVGPK